MKPAIFVALILICVVSGFYAQNPDLWLLDYTLESSQSFILKQTESDNEGNTLVLGNLNGTMILGDEVFKTHDMTNVIFKLDPAGNLVWFWMLDYSLTQYHSIDIDSSGNCYVLGTVWGDLTVEGIDLPHQGQNDFFVLKFSAQGSLTWAKQAGGCKTGRPKLTATATGEVFIAGEFRDTSYIGTNTFVSADDEDIFITKMSSSGDFIWARQIQCQGETQITCITADILGNVFFTGDADESLIFTDGIVLTDDYYMSYFAKYNNNGQCLMARLLGSPNYSSDDYNMRSLLPDQNGGCYLYYSLEDRFYTGGVYQFCTIMRVGRVNTQGNITVFYSSVIGQSVGPQQMLRDQNGNILITGIYRHQFSFGNFSLNKEKGYFICRFAANGNPISAMDPFTGDSEDGPERFTLNPDGTMNLSFSSNDRVVIGDFEVLQNPSDSSFYAVKLNPDYSVNWVLTSWIQAHKSTCNDLSIRGDSFNSCGSFTRESPTLDAVLRNRSESDIFVTKMFTNHVEYWTTSAGGSGNDEGNAIIIDLEGNSYVTGSFSTQADFGAFSINSQGDRDIFVAKLDPMGNWLWARSAGGIGADIGYDIKLDGSGNLIVCGAFSGLASFTDISVQSSGGSDIFVAKMSSEGSWISCLRFGGVGDDQANAIGLAPDGSIVVAGEFSHTVSFGADMIASLGEKDAFLTSLTPDFTWLWTRTAGGNQNDSGVDLGFDPQNNIYFTGNFAGDSSFGPVSLCSLGFTDVFLSKLNSQGNWLWTNQAGGANADSVSAIAVDHYGSSAIIGSYTGFLNYGDSQIQASGDSDAFISYQDQMGYCHWLKSMGGLEYDSGNAVTMGPEEQVYIAGSTSGPFYCDTSLIYPEDCTISYLGCIAEFVDIEDEYVTPVPDAFRAVYPNPFSCKVHIEYENFRRGEVKLVVYNLKGQFVRSIIDAPQDKGLHQLEWDGLDSKGLKCAGGIYLLHLQSSGSSSIQKVLMQRD